MPRPPAAARRNKYGAVRTTYRGLSYASKAEAAYAAYLDALVAAKAVRWWLPQVKFTLGVPENVYRVDYLVQEADLTVHAVDVKGKRTSKFNRDCKLWRAYGVMPLWVVTGKKVEIIEPIGGDS